MIRKLNWSVISTTLIWLLLGGAVGGTVVWFIVRNEQPAPPKPPADYVDPLTAAPTRFDWTNPPTPQFPLPPYARYLKGVDIVLDPGHGGRKDRKGWKVGPTGLREAEVNLRVAQFLRDFLVEAGAKVTMTRDGDYYLDKDTNRDLMLRAEVANERNADLFLSLHHNGVARAAANYTSVFYHGAPDDSPASLDAARWLLYGLTSALRLEQQLECGLVSDHAVYPDRGFAVLRQTRVPAVLVEASFFTNPDEEDRLREPLYNRREAYGLFLGLARWAASGLPRVELVTEGAEGQARNSERVTIQLHDGLTRRRGFGSNLPQINAELISVKVNGQPIPFSFDQDKRRVVLNEAAARKAHAAGSVQVDFCNTFGQHVLHPTVDLGGH